MIEKHKIVFISGANRGIGYELTKQGAKKGYRIIAGYRDENRSKQLLDEARRTDHILPFKVDVTIERELENLYGFISNRFGALDILINNAGIKVKSHASIHELAWTDISQNFAVNVGGPFLTSKYLYPLLVNGKDKKIINISSKMGSMALSSGDATPYRISKAGLNMLTKNQSIQFRADGITVVCLHPGWVQTDMGGRSAPLIPRESANQILNIIDRLSLSNSGEFISIEGERIPF